MKTFILFLLAGFFFHHSLMAQDNAPIFFSIDTGYIQEDSVSDAEWIDVDGYVKYQPKDKTISFKFERMDDRKYIIEETFISPDEEAGHSIFLWGAEKLDGSGNSLIYFSEIEDLNVYEWRIIFDYDKQEWVSFITRMITD